PDRDGAQVGPLFPPRADPVCPQLGARCARCRRGPPGRRPRGSNHPPWFFDNRGRGAVFLRARPRLSPPQSRPEPVPPGPAAALAGLPPPGARLVVHVVLRQPGALRHPTRDSPDDPGTTPPNRFPAPPRGGTR